MHLIEKNGAPWSETVHRIGLLLMVIAIGWGFSLVTYRDLMQESHIVIINQADASWDVREKEEVVDEAHNSTESGDGVSAQARGGEMVRSVENDTVSLETLQRIATEEKISWKILAGILKKESQGDCSRVGDEHLPKSSYGCYQINLGYHPNVTIEQAEDLEWSTRWTAKRLKANEWRGEFEMIRSHNGLVKNHSNDGYVHDVYQIISEL